MNFQSILEASTGVIRLPELSKHLCLLGKQGRADEQRELILVALRAGLVNRGGNTLLHLAVLRRDAARVRELLQLGVPLHARNQEGNTALHLAARLGDREIVTLLLDAGASLSAAGAHGRNALHIAAHAAHQELVELLLARGASLESCDKYGARTLHIALDARCESLAHWLLSQGAEMDMIDHYGRSPLYIACTYGLAITDSLLERGARANLLVAHQLTPLIQAARRGHLAQVQSLIRAGAEVNLSGMYSSTALSTAVAMGQWEIADYLLSQHADITAEVMNAAVHQGDLERMSQLAALGGELNPKDGPSPLEVALRDHRKDHFCRLVEAGAALTPDQHYSLLHAAGCDLDMIALLLAHGVDINASDEDGCRLVGNNGTVWNTAQIKQLVDWGFEITYCDKDGYTPLHWAAFGTSLSMIETLLELGLDPHAETHWGETPLQLALGYKKQLASITQKHGGDTPFQLARLDQCQEVIDYLQTQEP